MTLFHYLEQNTWQTQFMELQRAGSFKWGVRKFLDPLRYVSHSPPINPSFPFSTFYVFLSINEVRVRLVLRLTYSLISIYLIIVSCPHYLSNQLWQSMSKKKNILSKKYGVHWSNTSNISSLGRAAFQISKNIGASKSDSSSIIRFVINLHGKMISCSRKLIIKI